MPTPASTPLDRARAAWLAGDRDAWDRYQACLRQADAERPGPSGLGPSARARAAARSGPGPSVAGSARRGTEAGGARP